MTYTDPPVDLDYYLELLVDFLDRSVVLRPWRNVVFVVDMYIQPSVTTTVPSSHTVALDELRKAFPDLLTAGIPWMNLSAWGVLDDTLVVGMERATYKTTIKVTQVTFSGPPNFVQERPGCDLNGIVCFVP